MDSMFADLKGSSAGQTNISEQTIARASYGVDGNGTKFPEAAALAEAYESVHESLKTLSQMMGDQIEALGIAVDLANHGYQTVDEERRAHLRTLQAGVQKYYAQHTNGKHEDQSQTRQETSGDPGGSRCTDGA